MTSRLGCAALRRQCSVLKHPLCGDVSASCRRLSTSVCKLQTSTSQADSNLFLPDYRFVFPEFLPPAKIEWRNKLKEKLERRDMLNRRNQITIPEFYVGSIMAVTVSDPQAPGKNSRFLGICILREGTGLRASFTLRNVIENQGIEITYPMYNPTLRQVEVLKLERRLDEDLRYLRDSPLEYSTFPQDMPADTKSLTTTVPVNPLKVPLNPRPWNWRWERCNLQGAIVPQLRSDFYERAKKVSEPWRENDLMLEYRSSIAENDQQEVYADVHAHVQQRVIERQTARAQRVFVPPVKTS